jgi:hypothetical protein
VDGADPGLQEFADHVIDRLLGRGAALFPAAEPNLELSGGEVVAAPVPTSGGGLAAGLASAGGELARARSATQQLDEDSGQAVAAAGETGVGGRRGVERLRAGARQQVAAIMPMTNSSAGMRLMVSALDDRLAAMQQHIDSVKDANVTAARQLREIADSYVQAGPNSTSSEG